MLSTFSYTYWLFIHSLFWSAFSSLSTFWSLVTGIMNLILISSRSHLYVMWNSVTVQSLGHVQLFVTPWTPQHARLPMSFTISWSLLKFMSIELVMLSTHLILATLFLSCLHSFPASGFFPVSWLNIDVKHYICANMFSQPVACIGLANTFIRALHKM